MNLGHLSFRLATGMWCLAAVILANAYASTLIAYLTVPQLNPIVYTFQELAANKHYQLLTDVNTAITNNFLVWTYKFIWNVPNKIIKLIDLLFINKIIIVLYYFHIVSPQNFKFTNKIFRKPNKVTRKFLEIRCEGIQAHLLPIQKEL